jgi:hypothetical protein
MRTLGLFAAAVCTGCGIADFDIDEPIPAQTIQGSGIPAPLAALFPLPVDLDLEQQIKAMDTGPIDSVTLQALDLTITNGGDWSFVTSVVVSVSSTQTGTQLPTVQIASASSPGEVQTMTFAVAPGVNLKPYIDEGSMVTSTGSGTAPAQTVDYDGTSTFHVHPL